MRDVRNLDGALRQTVEAYVTYYYRVNKPLKIRERNSVIVMAEKLLITLWVHATIARLRAFQLENTLGRSSETGVTLGIDS